MRCKVQPVVLSLLASVILSATLLAEEADEITSRCEAEATEAGIVDTDEKAEYVRECIAIADLSQDQQGGSSDN
jgi:hypothetical protein